jgi:hypothetical protein
MKETFGGWWYAGDSRKKTMMKAANPPMGVTDDGKCARTQARCSNASNRPAGYESFARGCYRTHQTPQLEDEEGDQMRGLERVVLEHLSPHGLYGGESDEKGGTVPSFKIDQYKQSETKSCTRGDLPMSSIE